MVAVVVAHGLSGVKQLQPYTAVQIVAELKRVMDNTLVLRDALLRMQPGHRDINRHTIAGRFLYAAMLSMEQNKANKLVGADRLQFANYIAHLAMLAGIAKVAARDAGKALRRPANRPKGTPGKVGFEYFVRLLLIAAHTCGGKLTAYRSAYSATGREGSLLQAVDLLGPYLPSDGFFPATNVGSSLERIASDQARQFGKPGKVSR
jgi:hypothetical protein